MQSKWFCDVLRVKKLRSQKEMYNVHILYLKLYLKVQYIYKEKYCIYVLFLGEGEGGQALFC
jgi:hypothetical protein